MADKLRHEVYLAEGVDKDAFIAEISSSYDIASTLQYIPRCLLIDLTEDEVAVLDADPRVQQTDYIFREERQVAVHGYNEINQSKKPTVDQQTNWNTVDGTDYISSFIVNSAGIDTSTVTASGQTVGVFFSGALAGGDQEDGIATSNVSVKQSFDGSTVDLVILEPTGNENNTLISSLNTHPNFLKPSDSSFKIIPMDWSNYDGSLTSADNNQISNTWYVHEHAVSSAMAAAGTYTGWAKNSECRLLYLGSGVSGTVASINAAIAWHLTKPVNSNTGRRNATIINNSWGYLSSDEFQYYVPVDLVTQFVWYDADNNQTTVNRPGGGWANDFTEFHNGGFTLWQVENPNSPGNYTWCIKVGQKTRQSLSYDEAWDQLNDYDGIYNFFAAGNAPNAVRADDSQPQWNNQVFTEAGDIYSISWLGAAGYHNEDLSVENRATSSAFYPNRDGWNHETAIQVGGAMNSGLHKTFTESSSTGHLITTTAHTTRVYNSTPLYGYAESDVNGYSWSLYSGTSCAAPSVAGGSALLIEYFYNKRGRWPTIAELRNLIKEAQDSVDYNTLVEPIFSGTGQPYDWSSAGSAGTLQTAISNQLESNSGASLANVATRVDRVRASPGGANSNPGEDFIFCNTSQAYYASLIKKRFALPWRYRVVPEFSSEPVRTNVYQARPTTGQTYPRRKIRLGS